MQSQYEGNGPQNCRFASAGLAGHRRRNRQKRLTPEPQGGSPGAVLFHKIAHERFVSLRYAEPLQQPVRPGWNRFHIVPVSNSWTPRHISISDLRAARTSRRPLSVM